MAKTLTDTGVSDKITVTEPGWITCPICRNPRLKKVLPGERADLIFCHCRRCKNEIPIELKQDQSLQGQGQR